MSADTPTRDRADWVWEASEPSRPDIARRNDDGDADPALVALDALRSVLPSDESDSICPGVSIGPYVVDGMLGRGGMGIVYAVTREGESLALKTIQARLLGDATSLSRFRREFEVAERLRHPNLVRVRDSGCEGDLVYFVMDRVTGPSVAERLRSTSRPPSASEIRGWCRRFAGVARGLQHAHDSGVVHRDIKPSNLLLDADSGELRLSDFGIARPDDDESLTTSSAIVGTPRYMAPEQTEHGPDAARPGADIYSLCATLYEVVALRAPIEASGYAAMVRALHDERPMPARRSNPAVPRDLDALLLRGLRKRPDDRPRTAAELAEALERIASGRPLDAQRGRRRALRASLAVLAFVCVAFGGVAWWLRSEATRRDEVLRASRYVAALRGAELAYRAPDAERMRAALDDCPPQWRGFEWHHLDRRLDGAQRTLLADTATHACIDAAGDRVAIALPDGGARVLSLASGRSIASLAGHPRGIVDIVFANGGESLVTGGARDGCLRVWRLSDGRCLATMTTPRRIIALDVSPDGDRIAVATDGAGVIEFLAATGAHARTIATPRAPADVRYSPDGAHVSAIEGRRVVERSVSTGEVVERFEAPEVLWRLDYSPDGCSVAAAGARSFHVWARRAPESRRTVEYPGRERWGPWSLHVAAKRIVVSGADATWAFDTARGGRCGTWLGGGRAAISPDGRRLITCRPQVREWSLDPPGTRRLLGHRNRVIAVATASDNRLASAGWDGRVLLWPDLSGPPTTLFASDTERFESLAWAPDGRTLATGSQSGVVRILDAGGGSNAEVASGTRGIRALAFTPDGATVVAGCLGGAVLVVHVPEGRMSTLTSLVGDISTVDIDKGGRLVVGSGSGLVRVYDATRTAVVFETQLDAALSEARFSPDGEWIAATGNGGTVLLLDAQTGRRLTRFEGLRGIVNTAAFSPDGRRLAAGTYRGDIAVWAVHTAQTLLTMRESQEFNQGVIGHHGIAWSSDGEWLVTTDDAGPIRLWDGRPRASR